MIETQVYVMWGFLVGLVVGMAVAIIAHGA